jgi:hypothetical protein
MLAEHDFETTHRIIAAAIILRWLGYRNTRRLRVWINAGQVFEPPTI